MQPRIKSPALTIPGTSESLLAISHAAEACGVPRATLELVHLRVGQINGCSCVDMHARALEKLGEKGTRIFALGAWRETPLLHGARARRARAGRGRDTAQRPNRCGAGRGVEGSVSTLLRARARCAGDDERHREFLESPTP